MCGITIDESNIPKLKEIGVKDSKLLSEKQRNSLYNQVLQIIEDYRVIMAHPQEIDDALNSPELNLNKLEAVKSAEIINELKPEKATLDCPSNNIESYTQYLSSLLRFKPKELILEHKADFKYLEVAAASIIAKTIREEEVQKIKDRIGENIGSGYPSDPKTKEFIKKNYKKYPEIFRKTWQTYKNLVIENKQKTLDKF
jgi:ribonuclease HII